MADLNIGDEVNVKATVTNVDTSEMATLKYELAFNESSRLWIPRDAQVVKINPIANNEENIPTPPADTKTTVINVDDGDEVTLNGRKSKMHQIGDSVVLFANEEW